MADRPRCAETARSLGEALVGTASTVRRWLLVEQPGAWGSEALTASELPPAVATPLAAAARAAGVRILLVRPRPGPARSRSSARRCLLGMSGPTAPWLREATTDVAELASLDLAALFAAGGSGFGAPATDPAFLVCTHGRHDPCCADHGRPLVRALAGGGRAGVWESSHLGGDRFAGNLLCLPHGLYFGRVAPEEGVRVADAYRDGRIELERYRGRSCFSMVVQAAEGLVRLERDLRGVDDLVPVRRLRRAKGEDDVVLREADGRTWVARVRTSAAAPRLLTCNGPEGRPPAYELVGLEVS